MPKISRSDSEYSYPQNTSISSGKFIKGQAKVKRARGKDEKMSTLAKQSLEGPQASTAQLKGNKRAVRGRPVERPPSENRVLFYKPSAQKELKEIEHSLFQLIGDLHQLEFQGKNVTSSMQNSIKELEFVVGEWRLDTQDELSRERRDLLLRFEGIGVRESEEVAWLIRGLEEWGHALETSLDRVIVEIGQLEPLSKVREELESLASFMKKELFSLEKGIVALNIPKTASLKPPSAGWTALAEKHYMKEINDEGEEGQPGMGRQIVSALLSGMTLMQQAITTSLSIDAGVRQHGWRPNFAEVHHTDVPVEHQVTRIDFELLSSMQKAGLEKTELATRELVAPNTPVNRSQFQEELPFSFPQQDRVHELENVINKLKDSNSALSSYISGNIYTAVESGDLSFLEFISTHHDTRDLFMANIKADIDEYLIHAYLKPRSAEVMNFLHQFISYSRLAAGGSITPALACRIQYSAAKCLELFDMDWKSYHILTIKNLGHSWEVAGNVGPLNVHMEGFRSQLFEAEFATYITQFYMNHRGLIRDQELVLAINALNRNPKEQIETTLEEAMDRHRVFTEGKPVFVHTGFHLHAIDVLLFGDFLVVANKGAASQAPLEVFKITKDDIKPSDIETIMDLADAPKDKYQNWISTVRAKFPKDELSRYIEERYPFEMQQTVGNCAWESFETALYAMFLINAIDEPDRVDRMFDLLMQNIKMRSLNVFVDNMVQPAYNTMKEAHRLLESLKKTGSDESVIVKQETEFEYASKEYVSYMSGLRTVLDKSLSMKWDNAYQEAFNAVREKAFEHLGEVDPFYRLTYSISSLFRSIFG